MLERPNIPDQNIISILSEEYGIETQQLHFLPIGNDIHTAVYKATTKNHLSLFIKLRSDEFNFASILVPATLHNRGVKQVLAPLPNKKNKLWTDLDEYKVIVFPFITGENAFERALKPSQWEQLGSTLKSLHTLEVTTDLKKELPEETFSSQWRDTVHKILEAVGCGNFHEPTAVKFAKFIEAKRELIEHLLNRANEFAGILKKENLDLVLCHGDIHAGNVLLDTQQHLYIVDWDTLILAPKECDLMFIGGGVGNIWNTITETNQFYLGYGKCPINPIALAYYRYERILEDIAAYGDRILFSDKGGKDRESGFNKLISQFLPNNVVEIALSINPNI